MRSRIRGYASIWFLVIVAAMTGVIGGATYFSSAFGGQDLKQIGLALSALSAAAFFGGLIYEARRDFYEFCGVAGTALLIFAVGAIESGVSEGAKQFQAGSFVSAGIFTLLAIACFVYVRRMRRLKDTLPDPLREQFKPGQIHEQDGVQFAYSPQGTTTKLVAGETQIVTLVAQNSFDAERTFELVIAQESRVSFNGAGLEFPKQSQLTLPPLAAGQLTIPVRADPKAKGAYALLFTPTVTGLGGTRVRTPRGKKFGQRSSGWFLLLGHFGHLINALRPRLRFTVSAAPQEQQSGFDTPAIATALAVPTSAILWKSDLHVDAAAAGLAEIPQFDRFGLPIAKPMKPRSPAPMAIAASIALIALAVFAIVKLTESAGRRTSEQDDAKAGASGGLGVQGDADDDDDADDKPAFDAETELKIATTKERAPAHGAATVRLVSEGLSKHDRREFEMIGVPEPLVAPAGEMMRVLAGSTVNDEELRPGDVWSGSVYGFELAARVVEVKGNKGVLRIADVDDATGAHGPKMLVAGGAVKEARDLLFKQKRNEAADLLRAALAWYPGVAGAEPKGFEGRNINQNDNLAWLEFSMVGIDTDRSYQQALVRCEQLRSIELGGALPSAVSRETLIKDARALVVAMQSSGAVPVPAVEGSRELEPGFSWQAGPVVSLVDGKLVRRARVDSPIALTYFYSEPGRSGLLKPEVLELAAEIYLNYQARPLELLALLRDPIALFYVSNFDFLDEHEERPAPALALATQESQHLPALSRILAALGRQLAAGETMTELRADWELTKDADALASAQKKMAALEEKE